MLEYNTYTAMQFCSEAYGMLPREVGYVIALAAMLLVIMYGALYILAEREVKMRKYIEETNQMQRFHQWKKLR